MEQNTFRRRAFLGGTAAAALGAGAIGPARRAQATDGGDTFAFEISRTDAEWRERLSQEEYVVLRKGSTELPHTSPLVDETRAGTYCCKGCGLSVYSSVWKVPLQIGWVFFSQSEPRSMLMSIDGEPPEGMGDDNMGPGAMIEVHCRRCASHLGHIVVAQGQLVHCINGTALDFQSAET